MLVRFETRAYSILMLGDPAVHLLKLMGKSGDVPGAMKGHEVPEALERLKSGLVEVEDEDEDGEETATTGVDGDREPPVGLALRAFPLVELLTHASSNCHDVIWHEATH